MPVAIWIDQDEGILVTRDGADVAPSDQSELWLFVAKRPVTEDAYHQAMETGRWPDVDEAIAWAKEDRSNDPESRIDQLSLAAELYKEIRDDETARKAISLRAALLEEHKRADGIREEAKKPHLKAAREVDEMWMPIVKKAKKWADYLRIMAEAWETEKRKRARAEEEARLRAQAAHDVAATPATPAPSEQIRPGYGRAASVRERQVVTGMTNSEALLKHYRDDPRLWDYMLTMAQADTDKGAFVPGVKIEIQAVIR